ncbi:hypothetical protein Bca52824_009565 [Brassica carinata]|uniref:Transmembrane protein n=1 Tax=Brassica carinata TaxID=52824 RepID=A0A8X7WCJ5_BRACI|nr:hypothetical protein Bca52824_009565 [Brassica carinata]
MARLVIIFLVLVLMIFSPYPSLVTSRKLLETKRHQVLLTAREEEKSHMTRVAKSKFTVGRFLKSAPSPGVGHSGGGR